MSTSINDFSHAEIAREIRAMHPDEKVSAMFVGGVRRGDQTSARVSRLIAEACLSLRAKAKARPKKRAPRKEAA